jgi:Arc/MetJ family transcription regulator
LAQREWAAIPPRQLRLDHLVTTKRVLALDVLLDDDSTFYGDLFPHVVEWEKTLYLEDGLHRAVRAALQQRTSIHARVHVLNVSNRVTATAPAAASVLGASVSGAPVSGVPESTAP